MSNSTWLEETLSLVIPTVTSDLLPTFSNIFSIAEHQQSSPLLRQGEVWSQVFLIETGLIRMHFTRHDGKAFNKNFFSEKALLFPLTTSMQSTPSLFGISCIEDCKIWQCDINKFQAVLAGETLIKLQNQYLMHLLDSKLQREHDLLSLTAMQRYQKFLSTQTTLIDRIPLHHLATYLGVTDVSLSRLRRQFKQP